MEKDQQNALIKSIDVTDDKPIPPKMNAQAGKCFLTLCS